MHKNAWKTAKKTCTRRLKLSKVLRSSLIICNILRYSKLLMKLNKNLADELNEATSFVCSLLSKLNKNPNPNKSAGLGF